MRILLCISIILLLSPIFGQENTNCKIEDAKYQSMEMLYLKYDNAPDKKTKYKALYSIKQRTATLDSNNASHLILMARYHGIVSFMNEFELETAKTFHKWDLSGASLHHAITLGNKATKLKPIPQFHFEMAKIYSIMGDDEMVGLLLTEAEESNRNCFQDKLYIQSIKDLL